MKKILITIGVVVAAGIAWYLISPLFITVEVNEGLPENIITHQSIGDDASSSGLVENQTVDEAVSELVGFEAPEGVAGEFVPKARGSEVIGTAGHPASGTVQVLRTTDGSVIRYEDFETINGPDLFVYLANDLEAKDSVNLGRIKGTKGNINYEVPTDIDIDDYTYVMYWCRAFGVLFNYAEL